MVEHGDRNPGGGPQLSHRLGLRLPTEAFAASRPPISDKTVDETFTASVLEQHLH
jgi:hypothetical protein